MSGFGVRRAKAALSRRLIRNAFPENFSPSGGSAVTSLGVLFTRLSFFLGCDAQLFHRAHDRDRTPGIAASWRLDAAVSQRLRNLAIGGPIGCYSWP